MSEGTSPPPAALERAREVIAAWCEMTIPVGTKPGQSGLTVLIATALTEERTKALDEREAEIERLREALRALVDAPLTYNSACIEIECNSHQDAMERVRNARTALKVEGGEK